jgi:dUTP diphosphatase
MDLQVKYIGDVEAQLTRGTEYSAGLDLRAARGTYDGAHWYIPAGGDTVISCGVCVAIPEGNYGQVTLRSGLGFRETLVCHVGIVDSDYRGELRVKVINYGKRPVVIKHNDRFAQLVITPFFKLDAVDVEELPESVRGTSGFGSTGSN